MRPYKWIMLFIVMLALPLVAAAQTEEATLEEAETQTFSDPAYIFEFDYAGDWEFLLFESDFAARPVQQLVLGSDESIIAATEEGRSITYEAGQAQIAIVVFDRALLSSNLPETATLTDVLTGFVAQLSSNGYPFGEINSVVAPDGREAASAFTDGSLGRGVLLLIPVGDEGIHALVQAFSATDDDALFDEVWTEAETIASSLRLVETVEATPEATAEGTDEG